jgi:hypothetical protein
MPRTIADGMVKDARTLSTAARLSPAEPQKFGNVDIITFANFPKAEFVGEGDNMASTGGGFGFVTAKPHKAHVTMRFSKEVMWADEDHQLQVLKELGDAGSIALSRGLDLGLFHRINPLSGTEITSWDNYVGASTKRVEYDGSVDADTVFREAVGLLVNGQPTVQVNGAAFDPRFSWALSELQTLSGGVETGMQRYPSLGFATDVRWQLRR